MSSSSDPILHRQREQQFISHVQGLLTDDRLRVDTTRGNRPAASLIRSVTTTDREVQLKRLMSELGVPDRDLQSRMPIGRELDVTLSQRMLWVLSRPVGKLRAVCISPTRSLLTGDAAPPMNLADLKRALAEVGAADPDSPIPTTLVVMCTSGFDRNANELVERRANRTLVLVQPNDAGGWTVTAPPQMRALAEVLDPEADVAKRQRIRQEISAQQAQLLSAGLSADRLSDRLQLPLQMVEGELKSCAKENAGLVAKRLDGRVVLFRDGTAPAGVTGGPAMPFLQRVKSLFSRKGENEKKIALLAERRAVLSQQRDRAYEEATVLEKQEEGLRQQFKDTTSALPRRRITSQLLQLQKDLARRQQLLGVLNQQINVVSTHLHNLELVQQGQTAKLPDSEELAEDAAAAEAVLEELQESSDLAGTVGAVTTGGLSAEEQALYEELEKEMAGPAKGGVAKTTTPEPPAPEPIERAQVAERPARKREAEPG